jgi:hypothetical protein
MQFIFVLHGYIITQNRGLNQILGNKNTPSPCLTLLGFAKRPRPPKIKKRIVSPHILTNLHVRYTTLKKLPMLTPGALNPPPPIQISTTILTRPLLEHPPYLFYFIASRGVYFWHILFLLFT